MTFQIEALDYAPFEDLFALSDAALAERGASRVVATSDPGFPCRVSLEETEGGETLILLNYRHLDVASPYAATCAIFVRQGARQAKPAPGEAPDVLRRRLLSVRAFDEKRFLVGADVVDGSDLSETRSSEFENVPVSFIDIHYAKPGCFAARCFRASTN